MPGLENYVARLLCYTEGKDVLAMQEAAPALLAEMIDEATEKDLVARPAPGRWSVAEIVAHLADDEIVTAWRYRQMVENNGCELAGFDQDEWARMGDNAARRCRESLQLFRLLREANLRMLRNLKSEEWLRHGIHAARGKMSVHDLATHMAGHDMNHVEQIRKILKNSRGPSAKGN